MSPLTHPSQLAVPSPSHHAHDVNPMAHALNAARKRKLRLMTQLKRRHKHAMLERDDVLTEERQAEYADMVAKFRQLAISDGGLLYDKHRRYIWRLLACDIVHFAVDEHRLDVASVLKSGNSNSDVSCGESSSVGSHQ